jgi:hypothetical protein
MATSTGAVSRGQPCLRYTFAAAVEVAAACAPALPTAEPLPCGGNRQRQVASVQKGIWVAGVKRTHEIQECHFGLAIGRAAAVTGLHVRGRYGASICPANCRCSARLGDCLGGGLRRRIRLACMAGVTSSSEVGGYQQACAQLQPPSERHRLSCFWADSEWVATALGGLELSIVNQI